MWRTPAVLCVAAWWFAAACGDNLHRAGDAAAHDAAPADALPPDAAAVAPCTPVAGTAVAMRRLPQPVAGPAVLVTAPPGDDRLFVVEQRGAIRIYRGEALAPRPFLDLSGARSRARAAA